MIDFSQNYAICVECELRQKPCIGACACTVDGVDVKDHAERNSCPKGKHVGISLTRATPVSEMREYIEGPPSKRPDDFWQWSTVQEAYRVSLAAYLPTIPPYPEGKFAGRGLVICGGGKYFAAAVVTLRMFRSVGYDLPAELWHLPDETPESWQVEQLTGLDCVIRTPAPMRVAEGFQLKARAVLESRFEQVELADADSYPIRNPAPLFDSESFQRFGSLFFPDPLRFRLLPEVWQAVGLPYRDEDTFESGQLFVDKRRCWRAVMLNDWMNQRSDYYYALGPRSETFADSGEYGQGIYGDKDVWHLAWRLAGLGYGLCEKTYVAVPPAVVHFHPDDGKALFVHRIHDKAQLGNCKFSSGQANVISPKLPREAEYQEILAAVKAASPVPVATTVQVTVNHSRDEITRGLWNELHQWAKSGDLTKSAAMLASIDARLPCGECKVKWRALVKANPVKTSSRYKCARWTYERHDDVNVSIVGKPRMEWEAACAVQGWIRVDACQVEPKIWLGAADPAADGVWLRSVGITAIHNVAGDVDDPDVGITRHKTGLIDGPGNTAEQISAAIDQLVKLITAGECVYVHCKGGYSRSVYILSRALAITESITFDAAYERIKTARGLGDDDRLRKLYG